jgi:transcriptional regulator with XRE-family HTH domain
MELGSRIRKLRRWQGLTLDQLAGVCGVTKSYLSKIESGTSVPPVATLMRIAHQLKVSVGTLLDEPNTEWKTVYTPAGDTRDVVKADSGYQFFTFALKRAAKRMQPLLFEARAGKVRPHALRHEGEEFLYVLEGQMRYKVGKETFTLSAGDSLYFDSDQTHELEPISDLVRWLAVFVDPETMSPRPPKKAPARARRGT